MVFDLDEIDVWECPTCHKLTFNKQERERHQGDHTLCEEDPHRVRSEDY